MEGMAEGQPVTSVTPAEGAGLAYYSCGRYG